MVAGVGVKGVSRTMAEGEVQIDLSQQAEGQQQAQLVDDHGGKRGHLISKSGRQEAVSTVQKQRADGDNQHMLQIVEIYLKLSDAVEVGQSQRQNCPVQPGGPAGVQFASEVRSGEQQQNYGQQQSSMAGIEYKHALPRYELVVESECQTHYSQASHNPLEETWALGATTLLLRSGEVGCPVVEEGKMDQECSSPRDDMIGFGYFGIAVGASILDDAGVDDALDHVLIEDIHGQSSFWSES